MAASSPPTIGPVPIDVLRPDPTDPRRIDEIELEALMRSVRESGLVQPVLIRREDATVVDGHSVWRPPVGSASRPSPSSGSTATPRRAGPWATHRQPGRGQWPSGSPSLMAPRAAGDARGSRSSDRTPTWSEDPVAA